MTCLTDLIKEDRVIPDEHGSVNVWWAYLHGFTGQIIVKRWLQATTLEKVDDQEYAREEQAQGNNNILVLLEKPFCSKPEERVSRAAYLIVEQLLRDGLRVREDPARSPPFFLEKITKVKPYHRFRDIELD